MKLIAYVLALMALAISAQTISGISPDLTVYGQKPVARPELTFRGIMNADYQRAADRWLMDNLGFRGLMIKLDNEINYRVFGQVGIEKRIVAGEGNHLYEKWFIDSYNGRGLMPDAEVEALAMNMRMLQELLARRGVTFVFMITPSKAECMQQHIPAWYRTSKRPDAGSSNYDRILPALRKYGINHIDGRKIVMEQASEGGYPPFPKGGVHWSVHAATNFTYRLIEELERFSGLDLINLKTISTVRADKPGVMTDYDIGVNLNILSDSLIYDDAYTYPVYGIDGAQGARLDSILFDGGSFIELPLVRLYNARVANKLYYMNYFRTITQFDSALQRESIIEQNAGRLDRQALLRYLTGSKIVVIESNESRLELTGDGLIQASIRALM